MIKPRYQEVLVARIPEAKSNDGKVKVRVIAGDALGRHAVIDTHMPIIYLHYTLQPGGETAQAIPPDHNALIYVITGKILVGSEHTPASEGQMVVLGNGDVIHLANAITADIPADTVIIVGVPLREPIVRSGPFMMNTENQIKQAIRDFQQGRMREIDQ